LGATLIGIPQAALLPALILQELGGASMLSQKFTVVITFTEHFDY